MLFYGMGMEFKDEGGMSAGFHYKGLMLAMQSI